jgi:hypothetical protein
MEPVTLIDRASNAAIPAPYWFVEFFKALGFALHAVPMSLWYAGFIIALWLHWRGNAHARRFAGRLLRQMPIVVAFGINLGVVPLLFVQTAYFKVFYPATILMAWFWLAIIVLLIPAYYGVYAYAWGLHNGVRSLERWRVAAGWIAAIFFITIGFLMSNGLSLMDHVARWAELWNHNSYHGAALGTALNVGDPKLWPRWLLMFGLAMETTAAWIIVDTFWLVRPTADAAYRRWAIGFARTLYTVGTIWFATAGTWYVFGTWSSEVRTEMFSGPMVLLTLAAAGSCGLPWLLLMTGGLDSKPKGTAALVALCQFGVLGANAASRQVVQNANLRPFVDVASQPIAPQWGPMAMFLIVFILGLAVIGWMIAQVIKSRPSTQK